MKTSIACAIYNGESYLVQQLESLYAQTRPADEVILIDDHSTDQSAQIAKEFIEEKQLTNWFFHQHDVNKGYIQTFYDALSYCQNEIIFLCDQDDIWLTNKIAICIAYFTAHPTILCINSSYSLIDHHGRSITHTLSSVSAASLSFESILLKNISMGCTMAIKKNLVQRYLDHSTKQAPHDWELNILAASTDQLAYVAEPLIQYRIHDHNTTGIDTLSYDRQNIQNVTREKNAETIYQFVNSLHMYTFSDQQNSMLLAYTKFSKRRYDLLKNKNVLNWFQLLGSYKLYTKLVSPKGMIADIMYAILKKRSA